MDSSLAETVLHGRHVVLGVRLRALTFFHLFVLAAAGSPLVCGGPVAFSDLVYAVEICRRDRAGILRWVRRGGGWRLRWRAWWAVRIYWRHSEAELAAFHAYLADHHAPPVFWDAKPGALCKAPWPLPQIARLMHHGHMSLDEAWEMNPGFAAWLIPALQEAAGHSTNMMSEAEKAALKEAGHGVC